MHLPFFSFHFAICWPFPDTHEVWVRLCLCWWPLWKSRWQVCASWGVSLWVWWPCLWKRWTNPDWMWDLVRITEFFIAKPPFHWSVQLHKKKCLTDSRVGNGSSCKEEIPWQSTGINREGSLTFDNICMDKSPCTSFRDNFCLRFIQE